jgi:hypothetical protein
VKIDYLMKWLFSQMGAICPVYIPSSFFIKVVTGKRKAAINTTFLPSPGC